jgi:hypothetical protein
MIMIIIIIIMRSMYVKYHTIRQGTRSGYVMVARHGEGYGYGLRQLRGERGAQPDEAEGETRTHSQI